MPALIIGAQAFETRALQLVYQTSEKGEQVPLLHVFLYHPDRHLVLVLVCGGMLAICHNIWFWQSCLQQYKGATGADVL